MTISLYKKTHRKTGLMYLGKTSKNPHKYPGSGKYWKNHLKIHGNDCSTEVLCECSNDIELRKQGLYYSTLWNIVESDQWANLRPEAGEGWVGPRSEETKRKIKETKDKKRAIREEIKAKEKEEKQKLREQKFKNAQLLKDNAKN